MRLTPMRYKDYIWPHNPATYSITYERQVAVHKVPFGRYYMQDLGLGRRVMRGRGSSPGGTPTKSSSAWLRSFTAPGRDCLSIPSGRSPTPISLP